jgi:hypothetical protein
LLCIGFANAKDIPTDLTTTTQKQQGMFEHPIMNLQHHPKPAVDETVG